MKKIILLLLLFASVISCKKEDVIDVVDKGEKLTFEADNFYCQIDTSNLDIYNFNDFISSGDTKAPGDYGDVKILNSDTTLISVTKAYLNKLKDTPKAGEKLVLYLNDTTVLNKRIVSVLEKGETSELTVSTIPMEEVFNNLSLEADASEYYNPENSTKSGDNPNSWRSFLDESGKLHPAKTITYDENNQPIVIDHTLPSTRAGLKLGFDVRLKTPFTYKKDDISIGINPDIHAWGQVGFKLRISWFKLKECEAYAGAGVDIKFPVYASFKGEKKIPIIDKPIASKKQMKLFFVSIVPVIFNYTPGIKITSDLTFSGAMTLTTGFNYSASAKVGTRWEANGNKWIPIKEQKSKFEFIQPTLSVEAKAVLDVFAGPYVEFGFYGVYFGEVFAGGYGEFTAAAKASISAAKKVLDLQLKCDVGVRLGVSFKLKILKWELAKWKAQWEPYSANLLDKRWTIDLGAKVGPYYGSQPPLTDGYVPVPEMPQVGPVYYQ